MKFKFKLESILNLRTHKQQAEKQKLAVLLKEKEELDQELKRRLDNIGKITSKASKQKHVNQSMEKMVQHFVLIEGKILNQIREKIMQTKELVLRQRQQVIEADQQLQIIQKLKKKAFVEYLREVERKEQIFQNEIATQIYYKQISNG
ncbi:MAG: hypothetical protein WEA56_08800 [Balneolaceae bacterium]